MIDKPTQSPPKVDVSRHGDTLRMAISGSLSAGTLASAWEQVRAPLGEKADRIEVDASGINYCDVAGMALIVEIQLRASSPESVTVTGMSEDFLPLLRLFNGSVFSSGLEAPAAKESLPEEIGRGAATIWQDLMSQITFIGELLVAMVAALRRPSRIRWRDAFLKAEIAGVDALPIVLLVGFLMGLIMAFQGAIAMQQFGVDIYVADLVAISMFRELGPLLTAVVMAGRTASAFAAEIGTMKVNEEVDALQTMGIEPVPFLIVPRMIAAVMPIPILTLFANLSGLVGGLLVVMSLGYPPVVFFRHVQSASGLGDLVGGLFKALFFGVVIAGVGCMRGLQTGKGASAVGESTTKAVVTTIILIALLDGLFSIVFYSLGI